MKSGRPICHRVRLLGGEVDAVTPTDVLDFADAIVASGGAAVVANHNAHSLFLLNRTPGLRAYFEDADLVQINSTPMIAWGRLLGLPVSPEHRSTYLDWRDAFWELASERGWRVFYLGGGAGVAAKATERLAASWPNVTLASRDGFFDARKGSSDNRSVLDEIAAFDPDILFVGMGMPRQELWIHENRGDIARGVIFSVGAAFDYEAGEQTAAPRWTGRLGLEWLFRLVSQPGRLAYRYLVEPWYLVPPALSDVSSALSGRR